MYAKLMFWLFIFRLGAGASPESVPQDWHVQVRVNQKELPKPQNFEQYLAYIENIHRLIEQPRDSVEIELAEYHYTIYSRPKSYTRYHVVYQMVDSIEELWIAKASLKSLELMRERKRLFDTLRADYEPYLPKFDFFMRSPLALVVTPVEHESLSAYLFRRKYLKANNNHIEIIKNSDFDSFYKNIVNFADLKISLSSHNIGVVYLDKYFSQIQGMIFSDLVPANFDEQSEVILDSPQSYIASCADLIQAEIKSGFREVQVLGFDQCQQDDFLGVETLEGESLHICGLDKFTHERIMRTSEQFLKKYSMQMSNYFYFGSRVMPRTEVIRRDLDLEHKIPLLDDGVQKANVRVGGLTQISDLEILITFVSDHKFSKQELDIFKTKLRNLLNNNFYAFKLAVKLLQVDKRASAYEEFLVFQKDMAASAKFISPYQFAPVLLEEAYE